MNKAALAAIALFLSPLSVAQTVYEVNLSFTSGLDAPVGKFSTGRLDLLSTPRHMSVNGTLITDDGFGAPATGSCFETDTGSVFCNLQVDQMSINMEIQADLSGFSQLKDGGGNVVSTSALVVSFAN